jgi:hypothetical protein
MSAHIPYSGHQKERLGKIRLSDVLSGRMDLRAHNMPSVHLKFDFGEIDEAKFQDVEEPFEVIFFILCIEESDLDEFA